jgi:3,4-dihydroxy 2-butanone 4-phosphate synthase / GTP cyclohydrolase II
MTDTKAGASQPHIQRIAEFIRPTIFGAFNIISYNKDGNFIFAITRGALPQEHLLVRVQSACLFGESLGVNSCDCAAQLQEALRIGSEQPHFLLVYLMNQEGRGLGMFQKIKAIEVEATQSVDMVEAFARLGLPLDLREYQTAAEVIRDVNAELPIRLMTNNPKKVAGLQEGGIAVSERVPLLIEPPNVACKQYLSVKKHKMGHILPHIA